MIPVPNFYWDIPAYALIKLIRSKVTRTDWLLLVISALFAARFVWLSAG